MESRSGDGPANAPTRTRRVPVAIASAAVGMLSLLAASAPSSAQAPPGRHDVARYVNPLIGATSGLAGPTPTDIAGRTFPGPVLPGGMMRMGPDTLGAGPIDLGYDYSHRQMRGFSLKRLSGAGCPNYGDVPITPTTSPITGSPVATPTSRDVSAGYLSTFSHREEEATPGYYAVRLKQGSGDAIDTQMTTSVRAAAARFAFPATTTANVIVNAAGSENGNRAASIAIDPARQEVTGSATSAVGFCFIGTDRYKLYFAIRFDRPFAGYGTWRRQTLSPGATTSEDALGKPPAPPAPPKFEMRRAQTGGYLTFDTTESSTVEMRVGISFVSVEGARRNLDAETAGRPFEEIRARAREAWNAALGKVETEGGSLAARQRFYTALYHSQIEPATFSDVDDRYPGMEDGRIHTAKGYTQYADFSGWDVYRSQLPLLALLQPRVASDVAQSLLADARQSGWLPRWSFANAHTPIMNGDPAAPALASMYALGARAFSGKAALRAMVKGATKTGHTPSGHVERPALRAYRRHGYIPHGLNGSDDSNPNRPWGSAATTLEYATADFAISRLAGALGERATCTRFLARSGGWRKLFNPASGYIEPRRADGSFPRGYDPIDGASPNSGFAEGNAAQYTWMVPFDPARLMRAMGGRKATVRRLDTFFKRIRGDDTSRYSSLDNEVNSNASWLYDWVGQPYKTQALVRRVMLKLFPNRVKGFPGNDDLGQMSAWYVFAALGFYPEIPGTDVLAVGSPMFPKMTLHLPKGDLVIKADGAAPRAPYVHRLALNGKRHAKPWFRLRQVARGGTLEFELGKRPDKQWGSRRSAAPPSFGPRAGRTCR